MSPERGSSRGRERLRRALVDWRSEQWLPVAVAVAVFVGLVFAALDAAARPGGGESFGGGRRRRGGGGGGGGGEIGLIIDLLFLCIRFPALGGVVLLVVIGALVVKRMRGGNLADWSAGVPARQVPVTGPHFVARRALDRIRQWDPKFSVVLFEDFLYTLYAQIHTARPQGGLTKLAPYLAEPVRQALADDGLESVAGVLVGSLRVIQFRSDERRTQVTVEIESNLTEVRAGRPERLYLVERLILVRPRTARSRDAARCRTLDCPNCGAPLEAVTDNQCSYCREQVTDGRFDWQVHSMQCVRMEKRPPLLTTEVAERGNELKTIVDSAGQARLQELTARDPEFGYDVFLERVKLVFGELQAGWSTMDLMRIRPHVSDNLFQYFGYWIDLYGQAKARNVTENARVLDIQFSNLISDATYDAITVRVFATGLDYTVSEDGKLLKGSKTKARPYTEYWTLIRGSVTRGKPRLELACANCGAPLKVNMAGHCEYCRVKVVTGDFDWVLSRIEQDDNYAG
jgi:hypothetical protein